MQKFVRTNIVSIEVAGVTFCVYPVDLFSNSIAFHGPFISLTSHR